MIPEPGAEMKILCFGDSNTYGYDPRSFFGSRYPARYRWVDLLAEKLNCEAINAGENGREIPRQKDWVQNEFDLIVVMLGTNDLLQGNSAIAVAKRMETFLATMDSDISRILLVGPPPLRRGEWVPSQELIDASFALNSEYKALSNRLGVAFADAGEWNIPLTFDGVHFTEIGHMAFAEGLANYLNKGE